MSKKKKKPLDSFKDATLLEDFAAKTLETPDEDLVEPTPETPAEDLAAKTLETPAAKPSRPDPRQYMKDLREGRFNPKPRSADPSPEPEPSDEIPFGESTSTEGGT